MSKNEFSEHVQFKMLVDPGGDVDRSGHGMQIIAERPSLFNSLLYESLLQAQGLPPSLVLLRKNDFNELGQPVRSLNATFPSRTVSNSVTLSQSSQAIEPPAPRGALFRIILVESFETSREPCWRRIAPPFAPALLFAKVLSKTCTSQRYAAIAPPPPPPVERFPSDPWPRSIPFS